MGIFIFVVILTQIDISETIEIVLKINKILFLSAVALVFPLVFIKALRWKYLMSLQNIKYSIMDSFVMYCSAMYIGLITPGRLGEFTKIAYLKRDGYSIGKSLFSATFDRLSDLIFLIMFGYAGILLLKNLFKEQIMFLSIFILIPIILLIFVIIKKDFVKKVLGKMFYLLIPGRYKKSFKSGLYDFRKELRLLNKKSILLIALFTIASWMFYYAETYFLAMSLGMNISFGYLAVTVTIAGFITLIPVSISGIGTRDLTLIILLSPLGVGKEAAISLSILILLMSIFGAIIGYICWFKKPIKIL